MTTAKEAEPRPLLGGELNAAISNAVVRIHAQYVGRGPTKAQTFYRGPVVMTLLEDSMTKAEHSLVEAGKLETVMRMRHEFQRTMQDAMVSEVERLTGRRVRAFMSDNHIDPDLAAELFVLDGAIGDVETFSRDGA
jgi:uncharacterized protein YbcI